MEEHFTTRGQYLRRRLRKDEVGKRTLVLHKLAGRGLQQWEGHRQGCGAIWQLRIHRELQEGSAAQAHSSTSPGTRGHFCLLHGHRRVRLVPSDT